MDDIDNQTPDTLNNDQQVQGDQQAVYDDIPVHPESTVTYMEQENSESTTPQIDKVTNTKVNTNDKLENQKY